MTINERESRIRREIQWPILWPVSLWTAICLATVVLMIVGQARQASERQRATQSIETRLSSLERAVERMSDAQRAGFAHREKPY